MATKTKTKVSKTVSEKDLMNKTISNLTDVVSNLESTISEMDRDVQRIKIRLGIWVSKIRRKWAISSMKSC